MLDSANKILFTCTSPFISPSHMLTCLCVILIRGIAYWLWGHITQKRMDDYRRHHNTHRIRKQRKILLPSGGHPEDWYTNPTKDNKGMEMKIPISREGLWFIDEQIREIEINYAHAFRFGSEDTDRVCSQIYIALGSPALKTSTGWLTFWRMLDHYNRNKEYLGRIL